MGVETIKQQTRATYGCFVESQSPWVQAWTASYRRYAHSVCNTKVPLHLQYTVLYKCYMPLLLALLMHCDVCYSAL